MCLKKKINKKYSKTLLETDYQLKFYNNNIEIKEKNNYIIKIDNYKLNIPILFFSKF